MTRPVSVQQQQQQWRRSQRMGSDASSSVILNPLSVGGANIGATTANGEMFPLNAAAAAGSDVNDSSSVTSSTAGPKPPPLHPICQQQQQFNFNTLPHNHQPGGWLHQQPQPLPTEMGQPAPPASALGQPTFYSAGGANSSRGGSVGDFTAVDSSYPRSESIAPPPPSMHPGAVTE